MLQVNDTVMLVVDVQGRLAQAMHRKAALFENLAKLIEGARILGLPIVWAEQNPAGLGPTIPEISAHLEGCQPLPKLSFSCMGCEAIARQIASIGRRQVLIAGIEAHICVYQTTQDLVAAGYEVHVVSDAVSSRTPENRDVGLGRCRDAGAAISSVETVLFELLKIAQGDVFKALLRIIK